MKRFKSLEDISALKIEPKRKMRPTRTVELSTREDCPPDNAKIFDQAMEGVEPIKGGGRQMPLEVPVPLKPCRNVTAPEMQVLEDLVNGKIEFSIDQTDEFLQAHVLGMDSRIFRKLKAGTYSLETHLDLHGLNTEQACFALNEFIRSSYLGEKRCVLVVTGRGRNSPLGLPVIKQEVQHWLTKDPLKRVVLAFCTALPRDGGAGAIYVLLRKSKKGRGKIVWDRLPLCSE
jgi:DNA-nicking Smr family endonuclease